MTLGLVHLSIACDEFIQFAIRNNETSIKTPTMNEFQIIMNKIQLTPINCVILLWVPLVQKKICFVALGRDLQKISIESKKCNFWIINLSHRVDRWFFPYQADLDECREKRCVLKVLRSIQDLKVELSLQRILFLNEITF